MFAAANKSWHDSDRTVAAVPTVMRGEEMSARSWRWAAVILTGVAASLSVIVGYAPAIAASDNNVVT
jgi:hypothetical protein